MDPGKAMSSDHRHWHLGNHRPAQHSCRTPQQEAKQSLHLTDGLWRTIPVMGALVKLTLGRRALRFWVYVTEVTDFILGLEVLWAYNATVELVHNQLQMGQE